MAFLVLVKMMDDDEKARAKRTAGNEGRETLHQYVGGVISNPITSDSPDEAERRGGSGTTSKDTRGTTTKSDDSSTGTASKTRADTR